MKLLVAYREAKDGVVEIPGLPGRHNMIMINLESPFYSYPALTHKEEMELEESGGFFKTGVFVNIAKEKTLIWIFEDEHINEAYRDYFELRIGSTELFALNTLDDEEIEEGVNKNDPFSHLVPIFKERFLFVSKPLTIAFEQDAIVYTFLTPEGSVEVEKVQYEFLYQDFEIEPEARNILFICNLFRYLYTHDPREEDEGEVLGEGMIQTFGLIEEPKKPSGLFKLPTKEDMKKAYLRYKNKNNPSDYKDEDIID